MPHFCGAFIMPKLSPNTSINLLSLIDCEGGLNACWPFLGNITYAGYGHIRRGHRKTVKAHRWAYEHFYGNLDEKLLIRHACDNRRCCNPLHLKTGKHKDNMKDMAERERCVKYPVSQMKRLYSQGFNKMQISRIMGCKPETVYRKLKKDLLEG